MCTFRVFLLFPRPSLTLHALGLNKACGPTVWNFSLCGPSASEPRFDVCLLGRPPCTLKPPGGTVRSHMCLVGPMHLIQARSVEPCAFTIAGLPLLSPSPGELGLQCRAGFVTLSVPPCMLVILSMLRG